MDFVFKGPGILRFVRLEGIHLSIVAPQQNKLGRVYSVPYIKVTFRGYRGRQG